VTAHKKWSIAKSILRFVACAAPTVAFFLGPDAGIYWLSAWLAAAEALGIAEEIGEP